MRKSAGLLLALASLAFTSSQSSAAETSSAAAPLTVKINPSVTHGIWQGWGTSLCWMGHVFGDRDDVADLLFTTKTVTLLDQKLPGLGLNIVRYNAGASGTNTFDGRRMVVSKIILPYRQIEGFWLDPKSADPASASWNWNADANQRAILESESARRRPLRTLF